MNDQGRSDGDYVLCPTEWHHSQQYRDTSSVGDTRTFVEEFAAAFPEEGAKHGKKMKEHERTRKNVKENDRK